METVIDFLKKNESSIPSRFEENARWRKENKAWLNLSRNAALDSIKQKECPQLQTSTSRSESGHKI